jgi:hypothetical protein
MTTAVNRFYNSIENIADEGQGALVELFVYFLTIESGQATATPKQVADCFAACDLVTPANVSARLSEGLKRKPQKYIKANGGYKLQRRAREALSRKLGAERVMVQTSSTLRGLEQKLPDGSRKHFLKEALDCFEAGANRAAIVMVWILAMDHLFAYVLAHKLAEFNAALSKDKGVKITIVSQRDDFTEIKETKFIELCRAAGFISNDVRKVLDQKLGTRNSCAHPSGITIGSAKVIDFVEDLIQNVILKYPI